MTSACGYGSSLSQDDEQWKLEQRRYRSSAVRSENDVISSLVVADPEK